MNETTHRFLRAIVDRVPDGRIAELRLFPAIRQSGIESAVAVVAVEQPELPLAPAPADGEGDGAGDGFVALGDAEISVADVTDVVVSEGEVAEVADALEVAALADRSVEEAVGDALDVEVTRVVATPFAVHSEATLPLEGDDDAVASDAAREGEVEREAQVEVAVEPDAVATDVAAAAEALVAEGGSRGEPGAEEAPDAPVTTNARTATPADVEVVLTAGEEGEADAPAVEPTETIALGDILALPPREQPVEEVQKAVDDANKRYAILTARYRLVLKGPDRGKWEVDIVHEADAPLATVERVARGVARRAGDESDPEHFSGEALLQVLERPSWATSA